MSQILDQVIFECTYRCGLRCAFCYNAWKDEANRYASGPELTVEQYRTLLDRLPPSRRYVLSGGEPLLRRDLFDIVDLMRTKCDQVSVLTSGVDIDKRIAKAFGDRFVRAQLPIHGIRKKHDMLTGKAGSFDRLVNGMSLLKEYGAHFSTSTVVSKANIDELEDILEFMVAMGTRHLYLIRFLPGGAGTDRTDLLLGQREMRRAYDILEKVCDYYGMRGGVGVPNIPCKIKESGYKHIDFNACTAGKTWFSVDPSGNLRVCNHSPKVYGNLLKRPFAEIMKDETLKRFRKDEIHPHECSGCKVVNECRGGCRAVAETMHGDLCGPDPLYEMK